MSIGYRVIENKADPRLKDIQHLLDVQRAEQRPDVGGREMAWIQPGFLYVVAYDKEKPLGFIHAAPTQTSEGVTLTAYEVYVDPSERGKKVRAKLLLHLKRVAEKRGLTVRIAKYNANMERFAERARARVRYTKEGPVPAEKVTHDLVKRTIHIEHLPPRRPIKKISHREPHR